MSTALLRMRAPKATARPLQLELDSVPVTTATVGVPYGGFLSIAKGGAPPYVFSVQGGAIPGIGFSGSGDSRLYSGTPTTEGSYTGRKIRVTDALGAFAETSPFSITVAAASAGLNIVVGPAEFRFSPATTTQGEYVVSDLASYDDGGLHKWVVGPLDLAATVPPFALISGTMLDVNGAVKPYDNRATDGLQKNPGNISDVAYLASQGYVVTAADNIYGRAIGHGYDSLQPVGGGALYKNELNFDPARVGTLTGLTDVTLSKSISYITAPMPYQDRDLLTDLVVLTLVSEAPAAGSFRPGQAATDKTAHWTTADVNTARLAAFPNYAVPGGSAAPNYATLMSELVKPWQYAVTDNTGGARAINAQNNQPDYGQDIGWIVGNCLNLLCTNAITSAQKRDMAYALIQQGEDLRARITGGNLGEWYGLGGGNSWPLGIAAFTCWLMDGAPGVDEYQALLDAETNSTRWCEFNQIFEVEERYLRITPVPFSGARPLAQYLPYMVGEYDWRQTSYDPTGVGYNFDTTYRGVVSSYVFGIVHGLRMLGILPTLNAPHVEAYYDRYRDWIKVETGGSNTIPAFHLAMYDAYRGAVYDGNPARQSITADGAYVWITADDQFAKVKEGSAVPPPATSDFVVSVNGSPVAKSSVDTYGHKAAIVLATPLVGGETVTLAYTKGTNRLKNFDGNELPAFTATAVTNLTNVPPAAFADPVMVNSGGTAYSVLAHPISEKTGKPNQQPQVRWGLIGIEFRIGTNGTAGVFPKTIMGTQQTNKYRLALVSSTSMRFVIFSTSVLQFKPTAAQFNPSNRKNEDLRVWFSFDLSKTTAATGMKMTVNDVDLDTTAFDFNSIGTGGPGTRTLDMSNVLPSPIGYMAAGDGSNKFDGSWRYVYAAFGDNPADLPDIGTPEFKALTLVANIGGNGENPLDGLPDWFHIGTLTEANSVDGTPNRAEILDLPARAVGSYT